MPYVDRGKPGLRFQRGTVITVREPVPVSIRRLALEEIQRHNSLETELQDTHRVFLRWSETAGTGEFNPEAEVREMHYDPLPLEVQQRVTQLVDESAWRKFIRKLYFSTLSRGSLAEQLGISRAQLYADRRASLWYFKGRFEAEHIPLLASPKRLRKAFDLW